MTKLDDAIQQLNSHQEAISSIQNTQARHSSMLKTLHTDMIEIKAGLQDLTKSVADLNRKLDARLSSYHLPPENSNPTPIPVAAATSTVTSFPLHLTRPDAAPPAISSVPISPYVAGSSKTSQSLSGETQKMGSNNNLESSPSLFETHIISSHHPNSLFLLKSTLLNPSIVAVDVEWKPICTRYASESQPDAFESIKAFQTAALLQITCRLSGSNLIRDEVESPAFVLDLMSVPLSDVFEILGNLFVSDNILKPGPEFKHDLACLKSTFDWISGWNSVELFVDMTERKLLQQIAYGIVLISFFIPEVSYQWNGTADKLQFENKIVIFDPGGILSYLLHNSASATPMLPLLAYDLEDKVDFEGDGNDTVVR